MVNRLLAALRAVLVVALVVAGADAEAATTLVSQITSSSAGTHQFATGISSAGVITYAQPAFTDISGTVAAGQLPTPTASTLGGIESITCGSNSFVTTISTSGVPSCAAALSTDYTETTKTTNYTTSNSDSQVTFNNAGAGGSVAITAPTTPTAGEVHCLIVDAAQTMQFTANTGQTISLGGTTSASAGNINSSTVGSMACVEAETTTAWRVRSVTGTWTVN